MSFKTQKEVIQAFLNGVELRKIIWPPHEYVCMGEFGNIINENGEEVSCLLGSPKEWLPYREEKTLKMFRTWFLSKPNELHYVDSYLRVPSAEKGIKCTCCHYEYDVLEILREDILKKMVVQ